MQCPRTVHMQQSSHLPLTTCSGDDERISGAGGFNSTKNIHEDVQSDADCAMKSQISSLGLENLFSYHRDLFPPLSGYLHIHFKYGYNIDSHKIYTN